MSDFSFQLKRLRLQAGITQNELAKALNVSQNAVFNWENGKREPNFETVEQIASFFDVLPSELMGWRNENLFHEIFLHSNRVSFAGIYATFGYNLYLLCDSYLSLSENYQAQLLSFADYLLKCDKGKDFKMPTEEEVAAVFPVKKYNQLISDDYIATLPVSDNDKE